MFDINVGVNGGTLKSFLGGDAGKKIMPAVAAGMERVGAGMERHLKQEKLSGQALKVRTGTTRRAVFSTVREETSDVLLVVGVDVSKAAGARAQDLGATIRPKTAKALTIPIGEAKTATGVARFSARELISNPKSVGYTGAFFKNNVLFGVKGGKPVALFALRQSVALKPVGYLKSTASEKIAWAKDEIRKTVMSALKALGQ